MSLEARLRALAQRVGGEVKALRGAVVARGGRATTLWLGTQAEYDALGSYDDTTVYVIEGS